MGLNFVERMKEETGAPVEEILACYMMARDVYDLPKYWAQIEALDNKNTSTIANRNVASGSPYSSSYSSLVLKT